MWAGACRCSQGCPLHRSLVLWQVPTCPSPLRDRGQASAPVWRLPQEGRSLLRPQSCHTSHVQACLRHLYFFISPGHPGTQLGTPRPGSRSSLKPGAWGRSSWPVGRRCWSLQEPSPPSPGAGGGCAFQSGRQPCVCTGKLRHRQPGATGLGRATPASGWESGVQASGWELGSGQPAGSPPGHRAAFPAWQPLCCSFRMSSNRFICSVSSCGLVVT